MSFDTNEFKSKFFGNRYSGAMKKSYGRAGGFFPTLRPNKLTDGAYILRFLPSMAGRFDDGYIRLATHRIQTSLGGAEDVSVECLAVGDEPCAVCQLLVDVAPYRDRLSPEVRMAFEGNGRENNGMIPWVRLILPTAIYAKRLDENDRQSLWVPCNTEQGVVLEIPIYGEGRSGLCADVERLFDAQPDINHAKKGLYLRLTKSGRKYTLEVHKQAPLQTPDLAKPERYPDPNKMYFSGKYAVKRQTYTQQEKFLETCWWWDEPDLGAVFDLIDTAADRAEEDARAGPPAQAKGRPARNSDPLAALDNPEDDLPF